MVAVNFKRQICIQRLVKTFSILKEQKRGYNKEKLIVEIMKEFMVCNKTAREYFNAGEAFFNFKESDNILEKQDTLI